MIVRQTDTDPMNLKHIKIIRLLMMSVGAWPGDAVEGRPRRRPYYTYYLIVETSILTTGQMLFIINWFHELSFFVLGNVYITVTLSFFVIFRAFFPCVQKYGDIFREFFSKFHLSHFKNKDEQAAEIFTKVDRFSTYFTAYMLSLSVSGVVTFNLAPLYTNYRKGYLSDDRPDNITYEFAIHYEYPGFNQNKHYLLSSILNVWFAFVCAFLITIMDLFICLVVFQIIGHIIYLRSSLEQFPKPKETRFRSGPMNQPGTSSECFDVETAQDFDDQENEIIKRKIMDFIKHHLLVVNFTSDISNFFGPILAFNYSFHLFTLSILLVECMQGIDATMHYGSLTFMTFAQLSQLSIIFEIVNTESVKVINQVYYVPWESMSVSNQKSVCFLLSRVQTPISVTAMGMTAVGVQTMGSILKTTFSYCAFLRSSSALESRA